MNKKQAIILGVAGAAVTTAIIGLGKTSLEEMKRLWFR